MQIRVFLAAVLVGIERNSAYDLTAQGVLVLQWWGLLFRPELPTDGWSRPDLQRLFVVIVQMQENAELVSISALQEKEFGKEVFDRVIVVEFGGETAAFDAFHPKGYVIEGRYVPISKLGHERT